MIQQIAIQGSPRTSSSEGGFILVTVLVLLFVLALLGTSGIRTSLLEERMSGNARDRSIAFEAAEAALRDAERELLDPAKSLTDIEDSHWVGTDPTSFWLSTAWGVAVSRTYQGMPLIGPDTGISVNTSPRFRVRYIGQRTFGDESLKVGGYGANTAKVTLDLFLVTARGTGGSDDAQVVLQSYVARRADE